MCVCVCLAREKAGMKAIGEEMTSNQKRRYMMTCLMLVCRHISTVTMSRMGMRKGWPVITQELGSRNLQLDKIQKHAHHFFRVVVCVWTRKNGYTVSGFTQGKSGGVGI